VKQARIGAGARLALVTSILCPAIAPAGEAPAPAPPGLRAELPPEIAIFRADTAFAAGAASYAAELLGSGATFRGAEWALALAGAAGSRDRRAAALLERLPPGSLTDEELRLLGERATRYGPGTAPALLVLARHAARDRRPAAGALVAAARALGADSAAAVAVGCGWPPARPLAHHTIGLLAPLSGRWAMRGESFVRGAQLAVEEHNAGARFPLDLAVADTRGELLGGARAAIELVHAGVGALAGDAALDPAVSAAAAAAAAGVPFVSTAEGLAGVGPIGPGVFTLAVPSDRQAAALAEAAVRDLGWARLAILAPEGAGPQALSTTFAAEVERLGGQVVARESYRPSETNFATPLGVIAAANPDAVFIPGSPRELLAAVPQLAYYEVQSRVLGLEELGDPAVLEKVREYLDPGLFTRGAYSLGASATAFVPAFTARYRSAPDGEAARGYVAVRTLAAAYAAGASTPDQIAAVLARQCSPEGFVIVPAEGVARVEVFLVSGTSPVQSLSAERQP
jgi:branched-chain amino acid transport system substrate-binding protein